MGERKTDLLHHLGPMIILLATGCNGAVVDDDAVDDLSVEDVSLDETATEDVAPEGHEDYDEGDAQVPDADDPSPDDVADEEAELPPMSAWAMTYGGMNGDAAASVQQTPDGGYIVAGRTQNFGAGRYDVWVVKLDADGGIVWEKTYGDLSDEGAVSLRPTTDGGYVLAGNFDPPGGAALVIKLEADGSIEWFKTYNGDATDEINDIMQTSDGGYLFVGETSSFGESFNAWVVKLDGSGNVSWQTQWGYGNFEAAYGAVECADGTFLIVGRLEHPEESGNLALVKLDPYGDLVWAKDYGDTGVEVGYDIQAVSANEYIVAGVTLTLGDDQAESYWVLKVDDLGNILWQKAYGTADEDNVRGIRLTGDGGYIVGGYRYDFDTRLSDFLVIKLSGDGAIEWQKTYGGANDDVLSDLQQTLDGGYIIVGRTKTFGLGNDDMWVLKTDESGNISDDCPADMIRTAYAVPTDTSVAADVYSLYPYDTTCEPYEVTSISPLDSLAGTETQCTR